MIELTCTSAATQHKSNTITMIDAKHLASLRLNLSLTILLLIMLGVSFNLSQIDMLVASLFADGSSGFPLSKHWITDTVLHVYAARLTAAAAILLIAFNIWQAWRPSFSRRVIVSARYLFLSWASSLLVISLLKRVTTLPCPWNLKAFGGSVDYLPIYELFSRSYEVGECFPSAHASGGYGLIGLGFVALVFGLPMRKGLILPLLIGLIYGGAQIVRGAHFLSHDLFTVAISLTFAWFWAEAYLLWSDSYLADNSAQANTAAPLPIKLTDRQVANDEAIVK